MREVTQAGGIISTVAGGGTLGGSWLMADLLRRQIWVDPTVLLLMPWEIYTFLKTMLGLVRKISNIGALTSSCAAILNGGLALPTPAPLSSVHPINIVGSFSLAPKYTLDKAAKACGFQKLDWQQTIIHSRL